MNRNPRFWAHWVQRIVAWSLVAYFAVLTAGLYIWGPVGGPMLTLEAPLIALAPVFEAIGYALSIALGGLACLLVFLLYFGACRLLGIMLGGPPRKLHR